MKTGIWNYFKYERNNVNKNTYIQNYNYYNIT